MKTKTPAELADIQPPHRLYVRQRRLLGLIDALGDVRASRDFQKLLFIYCQEMSSSDKATTSAGLYEFVPYLYGAFSFTCYADRRRLVDRGLIEDGNEQWMLTEEGKRIAAQFQDSSVRVFAARYRGLRGYELVAEAYRRYPYYAIKSSIADYVLRDDVDALRQIRNAQPRKGDHSLFTIGYEGKTLEGYLNLLIQSGTTTLCDVRRNAISRKYGFSKRTLSKACQKIGIRYEHLPKLGIESWRRKGIETEADLDALFRDYERKALPLELESLQRIRTWLQMGESVALTCYEHQAIRCHRYRVVAGVMAISGQAWLSDLPSLAPQPDRRKAIHAVTRSYTVNHL